MIDNSLTAADVEDIKIMYRDCKYKRQQIHILAEMYLVSKRRSCRCWGWMCCPAGADIGKERRNMDENKKTVICAVCGREFDPQKEMIAEIKATMTKDGSYKKIKLCMECLIKFLEG